MGRVWKCSATDGRAHKQTLLLRGCGSMTPPFLIGDQAGQPPQPSSKPALHRAPWLLQANLSAAVALIFASTLLPPLVLLGGGDRCGQGVGLASSEAPAIFPEFSAQRLQGPQGWAPLPAQP